MAMVLVEGGDQLPALVGQYNETIDSSGAMSLMAGYCCRSTVIATVMIGVMALW